MAVVRDVTENKLHEAEMRIASAAFETHLGIMITDASGVILRANKAFSRITGYAEHGILGKIPSFLQSGLQDTAIYGKSGSVQNYVGTFHDITKRKNAEREAHRLAFYDSLTELANKALLEERLSEACKANTRRNTHAALLYIDVEQLRAVEVLQQKIQVNISIGIILIDGRSSPGDQQLQRAEQSRLILPIGRWIIEQACEKLAG